MTACAVSIDLARHLSDEELSEIDWDAFHVWMGDLTDSQMVQYHVAFLEQLTAATILPRRYQNAAYAIPVAKFDGVRQFTGWLFDTVYMPMVQA